MVDALDNAYFDAALKQYKIDYDEYKVLTSENVADAKLGFIGILRVIERLSESIVTPWVDGSIIQNTESRRLRFVAKMFRTYLLTTTGGVQKNLIVAITAPLFGNEDKFNKNDAKEKRWSSKIDLVAFLFKNIFINKFYLCYRKR